MQGLANEPDSTFSEPKTQMDKGSETSDEGYATPDEDAENVAQIAPETPVKLEEDGTPPLPAEDTSVLNLEVADATSWDLEPVPTDVWDLDALMASAPVPEAPPTHFEGREDAPVMDDEKLEAVGVGDVDDEKYEAIGVGDVDDEKLEPRSRISSLNPFRNVELMRTAFGRYNPYRSRYQKPERIPRAPYQFMNMDWLSYMDPQSMRFYQTQQTRRQLARAPFQLGMFGQGRPRAKVVL